LERHTSGARFGTNAMTQLGYDALADSDRMTSAAFTGELSLDQRAEIWSRARVRHLLSGETLILQNTPADAVFLVVSGRFEIRVEGQPVPLAEIGVGQPIGEIAFLSGGLRTATAVAVRDSIVLELDRASFEEVARRVPAIYKQLLASLARRLADTTARRIGTRIAPARTLAVVSAGHGGIPAKFFHRFQAAFAALGKCLFLTRVDVEERFPNLKLDDAAIVTWLNAIESEYDLVLYLTDEKPTDWTRKAVRQADQLVLLSYGAPSAGLNPVEEIGLAVHSVSHRRLVRIHDRRVPVTAGTGEWLHGRDVAMHHHVSLEDDRDFKSLYRFFTGRAVGFVAGGGGGFGPAHVGIFKAFQEQGVKFDILGGASVGAALLAGFAQLLTPAEIDLLLKDIFVTSRGFKRRTLPEYSLLDHVAFDKALQRHCRDVQIEDMWMPYFAVATDVNRAAGQGLYLMRHGPLWKAVRASCSIPAVLPPMFTDDGRMLVDGGVIDNIPLAPMKTLKSGPNLIVHFSVPMAKSYTVKYESIPGRWQLLGRMLNPFSREKLPDVPGPVSVLRRCIGIHQNPDLLPIEPLDLVLVPPPFPGSSFIDFDLHSEASEAAYRWCTIELDRLAAEHNPALEAILATRD
jgi:NTE family protein